MFIRYIRKLVPDIMDNWNIERDEAIKLVSEWWNDMTHAQKVNYDANTFGKSEKVVIPAKKKQIDLTQNREKK